MDCVFCKIIRKELPSEFIFENSEIVAIKDIHPKAPAHFLILSKEHITSVKELKEDQPELAGKMILAAKRIADSEKLSGYKLVFNVGKEGGQVVEHIHLHLLGGWQEPVNKIEV